MHNIDSQNNEYEYYDIFLNSKDAIEGSGLVSVTRFNIGNINDFAPTLYRYGENATCQLKLKYFDIKQTTEHFQTENVSTILVEINQSLPNSVKSNTVSTDNPRNMQQSQVIGIVPVNSNKNTYSDSTSYDNEFVTSYNILKGDITITLKDQNGAVLTGLDGNQDHPYFLAICIGFKKEIR
jgi:hypothetical protein